MKKIGRDRRFKGVFFQFHKTVVSRVDATRSKVNLRDQGWYVRITKIRGGYAIWKTKTRG